MNLDDRCIDINTRTDFVEFVRALSKDYKQNKAEWENDDIGSFLEALAAWVEDIEGYYSNQGLTVPSCIDWKLVANMLMSGKIYE